MEIDTLLQALQAGGDLATIAIVAALWKLDRRVFALELRLNKPKEASL